MIDTEAAAKASALHYERRRYNGGYMKTLVSPLHTNGQMAVLEFLLPKGAEPPPHVHEKEDETFYVLEGNLMLNVNGTEYQLSPGDTFFAPRQIPHHFSILSAAVRMLNIITPGDLWNYFIEYSEPCLEEDGFYPVPPPTEEQIRSMLLRLSNRYHLTIKQ